MSQIDVSVLVPSYNHERFLEEAVTSALASDARDQRMRIAIPDEADRTDGRDECGEETIGIIIVRLE